jgi:hypothetical protein
MKTADGQTFHGQTLYFVWCDIGGGKPHMEVCHFPTIDTEHLIWSKCPRTGAKVSYGTVDDHYSSLQAVARTVIHFMECRKRSLDTEIAKWSALLNPSPSLPPGQVPYRCKHVEQHVGLLSLDPYEVAWRQHFDSLGHSVYGCCYLFYPAQVRERWVRHYAPTFAEGI